MTELVKVRSKTPNITIRRFANPAFEFTFSEEPIEMMKSIAEFLINDNENFEIVEEDKE